MADKSDKLKRKIKGFIFDESGEVSKLKAMMVGASVVALAGIEEGKSVGCGQDYKDWGSYWNHDWSNTSYGDYYDDWHQWSEWEQYWCNWSGDWSGNWSGNWTNHAPAVDDVS